MESLTFANPEFVWIAVPAIVLAAIGLMRLWKVSNTLTRLGQGPVVQQITASFSLTGAKWRWICVGLAGVLLTVAATRPRYGLRETEVANAGIDVVFVVDASKSMLVRDIVPNRIQGTFLEISGLLDRLAGGRVAFVPFAGIPFIQCPLTTDHEVLRTYMRELNVRDMPIGGTNIGRAITLAADLLSGESQNKEAEARGNVVSQYRGSKNRAIVLFSDGEDHEGAALEAAKRAAAKGIRIYTVGVGSGFGDPVPIVGKSGLITGTLKGPAGNPIFSKLNAKLLKSLAAETGGQYLHYANKTVVPDLFSALDALEKAEYAQAFKFVGEDRYQYALGPALLLLLLSFVLPIRTSAAAVITTAIVTACTLLAPQIVQAADPDKRTQAEARRNPSWLERENPDVSDGRQLVSEGKVGEALKAFESARSSRPEHAIIWYDLGLTQSIIGQFEDATTSLDRALSAMDESDPELEADIHYTAGTAQLLWGQSLLSKAANAQQANANGTRPDPAPANPPANPTNKTPKADKAKTQTELALEHFRTAVERLQMALIKAPTRGDIKHNLELARMLAYPPCERRDRAMEPNDEPSQAKALKLNPKERETKFSLLSCPVDRDLFRLALMAGDRLTVTVDASAPEEQSVDPLDLSVDGQVELDVRLLSADGTQELVKTPTPATQVQYKDVSQDQAVLVDVRNVKEREAPYELRVNVLPACARL
ncbi:MAG TPA: hypothetical protein DCQ06_02325, partial [Myxococcales bacterium]|nr:hypothetical protein [Myxococcales bacterium]